MMGLVALLALAGWRIGVRRQAVVLGIEFQSCLGFLFSPLRILIVDIKPSQMMSCFQGIRVCFDSLFEPLFCIG